MAKNDKEKSVKVIHKGAPGGLYFITFIGAAFYFIDKANGFWEVVVALLQSLVWPAFVVYNVLEALRV